MKCVSGIKLDMFYVPNFGQLWSFKKLNLKISKLEPGSIETLVIWLILNSDKRSKKQFIFWREVIQFQSQTRFLKELGLKNKVGMFLNSMAKLILWQNFFIIFFFKAASLDLDSRLETQTWFQKLNPFCANTALC
jgi:hypothetical protein